MAHKGYIYYNHILSIPASLLYEDWGVMSYDSYKKKCKRKQLIRSREGRGQGNEALLSFHDLPQNLKNICIERLGDPNTAEYPNELEPFIVPDMKATDFFTKHTKPNGDTLKMSEQIVKATSCMILNAITFLLEERKLVNVKGKKKTEVWQGISTAVNSLDKKKWKFKLPKNYRVLERKYNEYLQEGYGTFIHKGEGLLNASSVKTEEQQALLEELLAHHNNLDNEQIAHHYNIYANVAGWDTISASTVRNWREKLDFYTVAGSKGKKEFDNNRKMLIKRRAPKQAMVYWTMDGWVAELLYKQQEINNKGHKTTSYTNRLTVVMVLDASTNYIVGYSIGTQESPALIKSAIRNALNHTRELFGERYKPFQVQTDNYGRGNLTSLYEASSYVYTPAEVGNAKSKVIERMFGWFNKEYFQKGLAPNWSGYGIKSDNQPNMEWINKNKHLIPEREGCEMQLIKAIEADRMKKRADYLQAWELLPQEDRIPMSLSEYLKWFGEDTGFTNRLHNTGITPTIAGIQRTYESFDHQFRMFRHEDWLIKFDPDDMTQVLAINARKNRHGKVEEVIGTREFLLEEKYEQPMDIYSQKEGDRKKLEQVRTFNKEYEQMIIERMGERREILTASFERLTANNPELELLQKALITDSRGQHKNRLSEAREGEVVVMEAPKKKAKKKEEVKKLLTYADFEEIEETTYRNSMRNKY